MEIPPSHIKCLRDISWVKSSHNRERMPWISTTIAKGKGLSWMPLNRGHSNHTLCLFIKCRRTPSHRLLKPQSQSTTEQFKWTRVFARRWLTPSEASTIPWSLSKRVSDSTRWDHLMLSQTIMRISCSVETRVASSNRISIWIGSQSHPRKISLREQWLIRTSSIPMERWSVLHHIEQSLGEWTTPPWLKMNLKMNRTSLIQMVMTLTREMKNPNPCFKIPNQR